MPRKAFLLGRNTGSLRHCLDYDQNTGELRPCDVQLMECGLSARGYEVILAEPEGNEGQISKQLNELIKGCAQEDTFIFYFSGHSLIRQGKLYLVLADDKENLDNLYPSSQLIEKLSFCAAGAKLLILDCCEAGQSVYQWRPSNEDNFRVLAATNRKELGKEFDDLEAGIFTHFLYRALTEPELWVPDETGVVDNKGNMGVNELAGWLEKAITRYGRQKSRHVPKPELYGPAIGQNVQLAEGLKTHRHTFVSSAHLDELNTLLEQANLSPDEIQVTFDDLLDKIEPRWTPSRNCDHGDIDCLLDNLIDAGHLRKANVPVPLLEFIVRLTDVADNAQALGDWVDEVARSLAADPDGLTAEQIQALGQTQTMIAPGTDQPLYLMVSLAPNDANNQYYTAQVWFVDDRQKHHNVATVNTRFTTQQTPELLETALNDPKVQVAGKKAKKPLTLEFFLPKHLLDADLDDWTPGPAPEPGEPPEPVLTYKYNAVVRAWDRLPPHNKWTENWAPYWNKYETCRKRPPGDDRICRVASPDTQYGCELDDGKCLFILDFVVTESLQLLMPLSEGVAMLLWPHEAWTAETQASLQDYMKRHPLGELPEALRELRRRLWGQSGRKHTGHLRLLCDDPHRLPRDQEPGQQLSNPMEN